MKRHVPLILLALLALLLSGCEVFPYISQSTLVAPEATPEPSATMEPTVPPPTATLAPSATPTVIPTTEEITEEPPDPTPVISPVYTLQEGSPVTLPNFNHPEAGCDWLGVAGQVFDREGLEILGLIVVVGDNQSPSQEPFQGQTGETLAYGLGGYEIQIGENAFDSKERFWIQVLSTEGAPLTARHSFTTYENCDQNLILINFVPLADETQPKHASTTPTPTLQAYP